MPKCFMALVALLASVAVARADCLVVTQPFSWLGTNYVRGNLITDGPTISDILGSSNASWVVHTNDAGTCGGSSGVVFQNQGPTKFSGPIAQTTALINAGGSSQSTAPVIAAQNTTVTGCSSSNGVTMPAVVSVVYRIKNNCTIPLTVWPALGAAIDIYGTNASVGIAVGGVATLWCESATQCRSGI